MDAIKKIEEELKGRTIDLSSLDQEKTALIVIDMVKGFVYEGPLSSPRVASIVGNIVSINEKMRGFKKIFFIDSHDECSEEFAYFPKHCVKGTTEEDLIEDLKTDASEDSDTVFIRKNSTNGFNHAAFQDWLKRNSDVCNFIVTGCVTDICVLQFVLSLKSYFNEKNEAKRVIVPMNAVETYDGGTHDAHLMNLFALYNMHTIGAEVIEKLNY
jgi:nicotinamidase-related amidase